jgi:predicted ATPase
MAQSLLEQCDQLTVLATSREPIGLFAERVFRLDPLAVPNGSDIVDLEEARAVPALALFAERARRVNSDFELTADNVEPVADLCRALDGLPLAIELAASRMGALELDDMLERLDKRLDLVGDARSSVGGRHKTLRSLLEWSYDLLTPDEQRLLRFLAAFPAGATLSSIEWLGDRLELDSDPTLALAHLVEASVIVRSRTTDMTRYMQLDTVQAFGRDQLEAEGESELAQSLLADWALGFAADVNAGVRTADEGSWDRRARQEIPNLRAARQVLLQRGALGDAMEISRNLVDWLQFRDLEELHVWTDEIYELSATAEDSVKTTAMAAKAASTWARGDHESAMLLAQEVLGRNPDDWSRARATSSMAVCNMYQGDMQAASEGWLKRVEIDGNALDAITAALPIAYLGDVDRAWELFNQGIERVTVAGWPSVTAWSYYVRGEIEHEADSGLHVDHLERAVLEADAVGARFMAGVAKVTLVSGQFRQGDRHEAAQGFVELIDQWLRAGNWAQMWVTLRNVAELLLGVDDETSILLFAGADADPFATAMTGPARDELNELLAPARKRLDDDTVETLEARARAIDRTEHAEAAAVALRAYLDPDTE